MPYRDSLWTGDGRATGVVSSNDEFYNVIQYGDILRNVGKGLERHDDLDLDVTGSVTVSPTAHRMSAQVNLGEDARVYASEDDPIDVGLRIQSGHSGFHGLKYDIGAERLVCCNGMTAFISDLHFEQTHGEPFQPGLAYNAVDAVVENPEEIEHRLAQAQNRELVNMDESLLLLLDLGLDRYMEQPVPDLLNALYNEVEDPATPTLWETYNAATRALTHYTEDIPEYERDQGLEAAAQLLETGHNKIPEPDQLGRSAVQRRSRQLIEDPDGEEYWDGETQSIRELMEAHGVEG